MKDYYQVLGVSRHATKREIKQAYRQLVQLYHPDRNPDPAAVELIQEVNQAYDVLGDDKQRAEYDYSLDHPFVTYVPPEPQHRDPAYRRRGYRPPPEPKEDPQREIMLKGLPYASRVGWISLFVCVFILTDFLLPTKMKIETITAFRVFQSRRTHALFIATDAGRELNIGNEEVATVSVGDKLLIRESQILEVVSRIESEDGSLSITNLATMYSNFSFVPMVLFVLALATIISFRMNFDVEFKFNVGLVTFMVLIFTIIMMLT